MIGLANAQHTDAKSCVCMTHGANHQANTSALEKRIDEMVYVLYGLTPEEIAVVEGKDK